MFSTIYSLVWKHPGIDTPKICLEVYHADIVDPDLEGSELAKWLKEWHPEAWDKTCKAIDSLIDDGKIVFMDDGSIYPLGYHMRGQLIGAGNNGQ